MLKDVKSSDYLTLNLEEEENPIYSSIEDKRSRQLREALDKKSSLKKFGSIIKVRIKNSYKMIIWNLAEKRFWRAEKRNVLPGL